MAKRRKRRKKVRSRIVLQLAGGGLDGGILEALRDGKPLGEELDLPPSLWLVMALVMKKAIHAAGLHRQHAQMPAQMLAKELKMWGIGDGTAESVHPLIFRLRQRLDGWARHPVPAVFGARLIVTGVGYWIDYPPELLSVLEIPPDSAPPAILAVRPPGASPRNIDSGPSGPVTPA
jgi:hypothetical protein